MATVTTKVCDVCGKVIEGVEEYSVSIAQRRCPEGKESDTVFSSAGIDLCPRDLERLQRKIDMGLNPPVKQKDKPQPQIETT